MASISTIHRSPCQLRTSPRWPLYCAALVKPWTTTWLPGNSSAALRLLGLSESCAPLFVVTVTRSAFPGLGPNEEQYSSFSSGLDARPVIWAWLPFGQSLTSMRTAVQRWPAASAYERQPSEQTLSETHSAAAQGSQG